MSGKSEKKSARKLDRRVVKTREMLGDALVDLMHERPFEEITVQHVLDRAEVGRSTFYSHYSDKQDLFLSDVDDFFALMASLLSRRNEMSKRVAPVRELFSHVAEAGEFHAAMVKSGKMPLVMQLGQEHFARAIEERLENRANAKARAHALAGAMFSLLNWWLGQRVRPSAGEMDELFHRMVWEGVGSSDGASSQARSPQTAPTQRAKRTVTKQDSPDDSFDVRPLKRLSRG